MPQEDGGVRPRSNDQSLTLTATGATLDEQEDAMRDLSMITDEDVSSQAMPALETQTAILERPHPDAEEAARTAWRRVRVLFEDAAADPTVVERVQRAEIAVCVRALDLEDEAFVVDARDGLSLRDGDTRCDAEIGLHTADLERLADGRLRMAMAIAKGRAPYSGQIRRFLWVLPVIQAIVRPPVAVGSDQVRAGGTSS